MKNLIKKWWRELCYEPGDPRLNGNVKVAVIGGGTGLSTLLRGLKNFSSEITAIVAVTDDGASSGAIKREFDILPPGDIRKCISALAYDESLFSEIMEFRFDSKVGSSLSGHTLGNIWITALTQYLGSFEKAVEVTSQIFETAGKVVPATLDKVELCAKYTDGTKICGESRIPQAGKEIKEVYLSREKAKGYTGAVEAIRDADMIIFGPGSLFTSVIPNLLIKDIKEAIRANNRSLNIYVCNCSTERGETENFSVQDHINSIFEHCGGKAFDYCLVNNKILKKSENASELGNIHNITSEKKNILGCQIAAYDLVCEENPLYHDANKLAKAVIELYNKVKK